MSIAGGLDRAVERARIAGCDVFQIFTKNASQWRARELSAEEVDAFRRRLAEEGLGGVSAHDSYLINLASPDEVLRRRSIDALTDELRRCEALGVGHVVAHPGAHMGAGVRRGIARIAAALNEIHRRLPEARTRILLEVWAGQGTTIGSRFEEIAEILERVRAPERVGVCFDTCHAFAGGYDFRTEEGYDATFRAFDRILGLDRLKAFHLNDSKGDLGCRVDRHEHIGKGRIGLGAFRLLMNDERFASIPMYLETPKGPDLREDIENLAALRSLIGAGTPGARAARRSPEPAVPAPASAHARRSAPTRAPRPGTRP